MPQTVADRAGATEAAFPAERRDFLRARGARPWSDIAGAIESPGPGHATHSVRGKRRRAAAPAASDPRLHLR